MNSQPEDFLTKPLNEDLIWKALDKFNGMVSFALLIPNAS